MLKSVSGQAAALSYLREHLASQACKACMGFKGPFKECVLLDNHMNRKLLSWHKEHKKLCKFMPLYRVLAASYVTRSLAARQPQQ